MTLFSSYLISRYSTMGTFEYLGGMAFVYTRFPSILEFVRPAWRVFLFSLICFLSRLLHVLRVPPLYLGKAYESMAFDLVGVADLWWLLVYDSCLEL